MTVAPIPDRVLASGDHRRTRLARRAVGSSVVFVAAFAAAFTVGVVGYAVAGWDAIEDTILAYVALALAAIGVVAAIAAFAMAVVAVATHERWRLLWLPLCGLPALLAFLVLGETFWWE